MRKKKMTGGGGGDAEHMSPTGNYICLHRVTPLVLKSLLL